MKMKTNAHTQFTSQSISGLITAVIFLTLIFLVACGGSNSAENDAASNSQPAKSKSNPINNSSSNNSTAIPTPISQNHSNQPAEAIVEDFISACTQGDIITALNFFTETSKQTLIGLNGGNPCSDLQPNLTATESSLLGVEEAGATIYINWEWKWEEQERAEEYRFILANTDAGTGIVNYNLQNSSYVDLEPFSEMLRFEEEVIEDPTLAETISVRLNFGKNGIREGTKEVLYVNGQPMDAETTESRDTTPVVNARILQGAMPEDQFRQSATQFARTYWEAYQNGDYEYVIENSIGINKPDSPETLAQLAQFSQYNLNEFLITPYLNHTPIEYEAISQQLGMTMDTEGEMLIGSQGENAIQLRGSLVTLRQDALDIRFDQEIKPDLIYDLNQKRFFMEYHGLTMAYDTQSIVTDEEVGYQWQVIGLAGFSEGTVAKLSLIDPEPSQWGGFNFAVPLRADGTPLVSGRTEIKRPDLEGEESLYIVSSVIMPPRAEVHEIGISAYLSDSRTNVKSWHVLNR